MVGYKFWEKLAAQSKNKDFKIIVFGEELRPAFDRVHESYSFEKQDVMLLKWRFGKNCAWLDKLYGGIGSPKQVIIEENLGTAQENAEDENTYQVVTLEYPKELLYSQ